MQTERFELLVPNHLASEVSVADPIWTPFDRRKFLRVGAASVAGASLAGALPVGESEAEGAIVTWAAKTLFGAAIGWFIGKMLDAAYESRYRSQAQLVSKRVAPTSGSNRTHDKYASPRVVQRYSLRQFSAKKGAVEVKLSNHLYATNNWYRRSCKRISYCDYNQAELITFHKFHASKTWSAVPLPVSCRVDATRKVQDKAESLIRSDFNNDPKAWKAEYTRRFASNESASSVETIGLASREDPSKKALLVVQV